MCMGGPDVPKASKKERPAVLMSARDGQLKGATKASGRDKLRVDLNNASGAYGSGLVIPT